MKVPTEEELQAWEQWQIGAADSKATVSIRRAAIEIRRLRALAMRQLTLDNTGGAALDGEVEEDWNGLAGDLTEITGEEWTPERAREWWEREALARVPGLAEVDGMTDRERLEVSPYIGRTLTWCQDRPWVRIARIDDEHYALTCDCDPTRLNVEVEKGIVVKAWMG